MSRLSFMPSNDPTSVDEAFSNEDLFGDLHPTVVPDGYFDGSRLGLGQNASTVHDAALQPDAMEEMDWEEENRQDTLIMDLLRIWTNERLAPDILDQQGEVIGQILSRIRQQVCAWFLIKNNSYSIRG
jgi:hypothetical protein